MAKEINEDKSNDHQYGPSLVLKTIIELETMGHVTIKGSCFPPIVPLKKSEDNTWVVDIKQAYDKVDINPLINGSNKK
jgi:hypothetical protein